MEDNKLLPRKLLMREQYRPDLGFRWESTSAGFQYGHWARRMKIPVRSLGLHVHEGPGVGFALDY